MAPVFELFLYIAVLATVVAVSVMLTVDLARKQKWGDTLGLAVGLVVGLIALAPLILSGARALQSLMER